MPLWREPYDLLCERPILAGYDLLCEGPILAGGGEGNGSGSGDLRGFPTPEKKLFALLRVNDLDEDGDAVGESLVEVVESSLGDQNGS